MLFGLVGAALELGIRESVRANFRGQKLFTGTGDNQLQVSRNVLVSEDPDAIKAHCTAQVRHHWSNNFQSAVPIEFRYKKMRRSQTMVP